MISDHTLYICPGGHEGNRCIFCNGGLFLCSICNSHEGATTTNCPKYKMRYDEIEKVYAGEIDFINGEWVNKASPHCPKGWIEAANAAYAATALKG